MGNCFENSKPPFKVSFFGQKHKTYAELKKAHQKKVMNKKIRSRYEYAKYRRLRYQMSKNSANASEKAIVKGNRYTRLKNPKMLKTLHPQSIPETYQEVDDYEGELNNVVELYVTSLIELSLRKVHIKTNSRYFVDIDNKVTQLLDTITTSLNSNPLQTLEKRHESLIEDYVWKLIRISILVVQASKPYSIT